MTFTLQQTGLTATGTTGGGVTYLQTVLPALSTAGTLLVATMQTANGGVPFKCASLGAGPGNVAAAAVGSGGTFTAGTYFWVVTTLTASGESAKSAEVSATIVLNGSASLTWGALPSWVTGVKVYRGTSTTNENVLVATLGRVTSYTDTGSAGTAGSPPAINSTGVPNTSPGWIFCGLAAGGTVLQAEIWAYPNNPGGLSGACFTNAAGAACRGTIQEWSTTHKWQILELFPGANGGTGAVNPSVTTNGTVGTSELAVALLTEHLTASLTGQAWTTPTGWTLVNSQSNNLGTPWATYYKTTTAAGTVSITGNYSGTATGQNGNAAVIVVFKEADSAAARVGVGGISASTYTDEVALGFTNDRIGACQEFDSFVGRKMAMSAAVLFQTTEGGTTTSVPSNVSDMWNAGAQVHYALKPQRATTGAATTTEQGKVDTALTTLRQAGITCFSVSFYNEFNNGGQNGPFGNDTNKPSGDPYGTGNTTAQAKANWLAYWSNWQPVAAQHGIPCYTKPGSASPGPAVSWQPPAGTLSGVIQDFYMSDSDGKSFYLDNTGVAGVPSLQDVCDGIKNPDGSAASNPPIPLGLGELGRAGGSSSTLTWAQVVAWSHAPGRTGHVRDFFYNRLQAGKQNAIVCWFTNNSGGPNWIHTPGVSGEDQSGIQLELQRLVDDLTTSAVTAGNPVITTTSPLPAGTVGVPYSAPLAATGGTTPYTWAVTTGALPAGLTLNATTGQITGTPSVAATTSIGFTVTDAASLTGTATLSVTIAGSALAVPAQSLPAGVNGASYSTSLTATGGTAPYTWAITSGTLPAGLALTAATGSITGTPTVNGTSTFTAQVTDHLSATASRSLSITVAAPAVVVTTSALPAGLTGTAYSANLAATGGTGPYTWAVTAGALPPGLVLSTGGAFSGTPAAPGLYSFTVQATDTLSATGSAALSIAVTAVTAQPQAASWKFLIALPQPDGTILTEVAQAQTRSFTMRAGPTNYHEASLDLDGNDPAALAVAELQADLQVWYGSQVLFCGRIGGTTDALGASAYRLQPTAMDYRQVLRRRSLAYGGGPNFNAQTDIADIAWDLLQPGFGGDQGVQQYPGGNLGISRGAGQHGLGITAQINYIRQQFAGSVIDDLCGLTPGSDWDITPYGQSDLRLDMWTPARGASKGVVFQWGDGQVASITRTVDPSAYANSVFVTGATLNGQTTVEVGSNGGVISNIASWSVPIGAGNLDVADSSAFAPSGLIQVHCSNHTNAIVSYTGTSAGGRFTGCQYVSGASGQTVSTGAQVTAVQLTWPQLDAADIGSRLEGRWDQVIGTQHQIQDSLNKAAAWDLQDAQVLTPSYSITLHPGAWAANGGPDWLWLGDTVLVVIRAGRLDVMDLLPVTAMQFDIDANGLETVQLTAGRVPFLIHTAIPRILRRLRFLETL